VADRPRRLAGLSSTTGELLALSPDEHDCLDFKETVDPLTDEYMAMMANAAALPRCPQLRVVYPEDGRAWRCTVNACAIRL
jgi:hypothetical protein